MEPEQAITESAVLKLAQQAAEEQAVELVELKLAGRGRRMLLRITIDRHGGVTLDDCAKYSRRIESMLDSEDIMKGPYVLEVSSPGLDRPLTSLADFEKNTGKLARVATKESIVSQNVFVGIIEAVDGDMIKLTVEQQERIIPFENIVKARLEFKIR